MTLRLGPASQEAVDTLIGQGFTYPPKEDVFPVMPKELTTLDSEELS